VTNALRLGLDPNPNLRISVRGFHPVFRFTPQGQFLIELVAQFSQRLGTTTSYVTGPNTSGLPSDLGGVPRRAATTIVASADGTIRYVISKPAPSPDAPPHMKRLAEARLARQDRHLLSFDLRDPLQPWASADYMSERLADSFDLIALHARRCI
jgi:hypothetical protein